MIQNGVGGLAFGWIEKTFPNLPTMPVIGRAGTIAVLAHYAGRRVPLANQVATAAAVIAGYQLGSTGKINGVDGTLEDDEGHVVHQVRGIAAQV